MNHTEFTEEARCAATSPKGKNKSTPAPPEDSERFTLRTDIYGVSVVTGG